MRLFIYFTLVVIATVGSAATVVSQNANASDPLVRVLQAKGILTETEVRAITANASPSEQRDRLAALLREKGVISSEEFEAVRTTTTSSPMTIKAEFKTDSPPPVAAAPQPIPDVIAAVAPVRL